MNPMVPPAIGYIVPLLSSTKIALAINNTQEWYAMKQRNLIILMLLFISSFPWSAAKKSA